MLDVNKLDYDYPMGMNLKPGSKLHARLITRLMAMAKYSQKEMSKRYSKWDAIDQKLSAYVVMDEEEASLKAADDSKPVNVIVPVSHALLDTLLTYLITSFGDGMLFKYRAVGADDRAKGLLLELLIHGQCERAKVLLDLYVQWRDSLAYGFGVVAPRWEQDWGRVTRMVDDEFISDVTGQTVTMGKKKISERKMLYEGNVLDSINPRNYFPDPQVPVHKVQRGEFVCILNERNYMELVENERQEPQTYFNARYLRNKTNRSSLRAADPTTDAAYKVRDSFDSATGYTQPIDLLSFFCTIIPSEWGVGKSVYPEKWLFEVAGDQTILRAQPLNLNHNLYPVAVCAPNFDGYSVAPVSTIELTHELQVAIDWLYKSRLHNVRTSLNNRLVLDPWLARYDDALSQKAGGVIRIREHVWGRGVQNAVAQLPVQDVTMSHWADISQASDIAQRTSGAVDSLQGVVRPSGERRSATEMRDTRMSALSRIQKASRLISMQSMQDLGRMFASHTQQFMTKDTWVQLAGEHLLELAKQFGDAEQVKLTPEEILIDFDVMPSDGTTPGGEYLPDLVQMFQMSHSIPQSAMAFDPVKQMLDLYRRAGVKDASKFVKAEVEILPDEQALEKAQALGAMPVTSAPPGGGGRDEKL